jgi:hypothetical protein
MPAFLVRKVVNVAFCGSKIRLKYSNFFLEGDLFRFVENIIGEQVNYR